MVSIGDTASSDYQMMFHIYDTETKEVVNSIHRTDELKKTIFSYKQDPDDPNTLYMTTWDYNEWYIAKVDIK
jgi:hypothetical protein